MSSLLDDVNRMLQLGYGDVPRLQHIKQTLEKNKMLYVSDRQYLVKLAKDHPESPEVKTTRYEKQDSVKYSTDTDLDLEELEDKIKVDSEPS